MKILLCVAFACSCHLSFAESVEVPRIQACFVLDTTGSMGGLIQGAKEKIWSIINEMRDTNPMPDLELALIGYRDRGDTYITRLHPLTRDLDELYAQLMAFEAQGGGDTPESVNQALHEAVVKIAWSEDDDVYKVIFLVGDAPPHMDYDEIQYPVICSLAREAGIVINAIQCGQMQETTAIWTEIAAKAGGQYAAIQQSGGMRMVETPVDAELDRVNRILRDTVVPYGDAERQASAGVKTRNMIAGSRAAQASRTEYFSKNDGYDVMTGNEDLTALLAAGTVDITALREDHLPESYRALAEDERNALLEEKVQQRKESMDELRRLQEQRAQYLREAQDKSPQAEDAFDHQVRRMVREQMGLR